MALLGAILVLGGLGYLIGIYVGLSTPALVLGLLAVSSGVVLSVTYANSESRNSQ